MKMRIFLGNAIGDLERKINDWLQTERITQIDHVMYAKEGMNVIITVWWRAERVGEPRRLTMA